MPELHAQAAALKAPNMAEFILDYEIRAAEPLLVKCGIMVIIIK